MLVQTLIAAFDDPGRAELAQRSLEADLQVPPAAMRLLRRGQGRDLLSKPGLEHARTAVATGSCILLVTVDETAAFAVREKLEEDSPSLWTEALPPQPPPAAS